MNKNELVGAIAAKAGLSKAEAEKAVNAFIEVTTDSVKRGDAINLVGFCTFKKASRKATTARNPRTGETIQVPAKNVVKIKAGKTLNDAVN